MVGILRRQEGTAEAAAYGTRDGTAEAAPYV
jgi:hypothetical protein